MIEFGLDLGMPHTKYVEESLIELSVKSERKKY